MNLLIQRALKLVGIRFTYKISGRVTELPINSTALITMSGDAVHAVYTDADGRFEFEVPTGTYMLLPSLSGHSFVPPQRIVTVREADVNDADFLDPVIVNRWLGIQSSGNRGGVRR